MADEEVLSFSRLLRQTRRMRELTQAECAEKIGTRQTVWSRWEAGALTPEAGHIAPLARFLGMKADDLRRLIRLGELRAQEAELEDRLTATRRQISTFLMP